MRKFMSIGMFIVFIIFLLIYLYFKGFLDFSSDTNEMLIEKNGIHYGTRVNGDCIEKYNGEKWESYTVKGISISDSLPDKHLLSAKEMEAKISEWLEQISKMNINTIRIPSIQSPAFYNAIYEFNRDNPNPLYIIHDIPLKENLIYGEYDGFDEDILKELQKDIKSTIDIIHGKKIVIDKDIFTSKLYRKDISQYVLGYVIGNQWDPTFVKITNMKNQDYSSFKGKYINADEVNAIEYILAEAMDYTIQYESERYNQQRLVSFLNTSELDPIKHSSQSSVFKETDINIEKIQINNTFHSGIFASYQVSPNDPDFLNISFSSENNQKGNSDFRGYLKELKNIHQKPILITNIGLSTSRGISKEDENGKYNRGGLSEKQQGEYLIELLDDIYQNDYVGAVVYNWQDDWGKSTTWNTSHIKNTKYIDSWLDVQSSEQHFGILQFVPDKKQTYIVDGKTDDWDTKQLLYEKEGNQLYATYNSSYLYVMIKKEDFHFYKDTLFLAIDVNPSIGTKDYEDYKKAFDLDTDFVVRIKGKNESDIQVQSRYNIFDYRYKYYSNVLEQMTTIPAKNTNTFDPIYLLTRNLFQNDVTMEQIPPKYIETGTLTYGNSDYNAKDYNSLADFYVEDDVIELRIPWLLINVVDPLNGIALGDFYKNGIASKMEIEQIGLQVLSEDNGQITKITSPSYIRFKKQKNILYHERKKESYKILQSYFEHLD